MKAVKYILPFILLTACIKTTVLKNGYQRVPTNPKVFKNRVHLDRQFLNQIDTAVIYEEYDTHYYEGFEKQPNFLARHNYKNPNTIYGVYRFYGNGNYNYFNLNRNKPELVSEMFDPTYNGWRGVLYTRKNKLTGDLVTQVSGMVV